MNLNESSVEDTTLEWIGALGYAIGYGLQPAYGEPASGRDSFGLVELAERSHKNCLCFGRK